MAEDIRGILYKNLQDLDLNTQKIKKLSKVFSDELLDSIYNMLSETLDIIIKNYCLMTQSKEGETAEWFYWYVYETDFGVKPMKACVNSIDFRVDGFDVFWRILEECRNVE